MSDNHDNLEPDTDPEAALDADDELDEIDDEEWRLAHESLTGFVPEDELAYTWAPGESAEQLGIAGHDEHDEADGGEDDDDGQ